MKVLPVSADEVKKVIEAGDDILLIDVRTPEEYLRGKIEKSINIPLDEIAATALDKLPDKSKNIYVYCLSGSRSMMAAEELVNLGYEHVYNIESGLLAWRAIGGEIVM